MPRKYIPVLRNSQNEREVIQSFGGLSNFQPQQETSLKLTPLLEISGLDDLQNLEPFYDAGDEVLIDLPAYQASRDTEFGNAIESTISEYGSRESFYRDHSKYIDYPVASGLAELPEQYGIHISMQKALQPNFPVVVHRIMVRRTKFNEEQQEKLEALSEEVRQRDRILFDVVEAGFNNNLEANIQYLSEIFNENPKSVLNIFNAYDGAPENRSPQVADKFGIEGFGDFSINVRYPSGGGGGDTVGILHYHPSRFRAERFEGKSYEEASKELMGWNEWNTNHCDYCRDAASPSTGGPSAWKRIRMGHYITSILRGEI